MSEKGAAYPRAALILFALALPSLSRAQVPEADRYEIDQIIGAKGTYVAEEGVYKILLPTESATVVQDYQTVPFTMGLNSWAAFSPAKHHTALVMGRVSAARGRG